MPHEEAFQAVAALLAGVVTYLLALRPLPANLFDIEGLPVEKLREIWRHRLRRGVVLGLVVMALGLLLLTGPGRDLFATGPLGSPLGALGVMLLVLGVLVARDQWRCPLCYACLWTVPHRLEPLRQGVCPSCETHFGAGDTESRPPRE